MYVLSRKSAAEAEAEAEAAQTRGLMRQLARPTVLVTAAVPKAKTAGMAARDGVRSAATWTVPRINQARAWTAPHIERSGLAIRDTIAPKVCETLVAAARRVDVTAPSPDVTAPRRRWPQVMAGTAILVAAGAAAAVVLQRRKNDRAYEASGKPAEAVIGSRAAQDGQLDANADGSGAEENVSRHPTGT